MLLVTQREVLIGGHFEQARGSCGTDLELVGARLKVIEVKPPKSLTMTSSEIQYAPAKIYNFHAGKEEIQSIPRILIGGTYFWKLRDDPTEY